MQGQRMALRKTWSWQDSNPQSLVLKTNALSIRPQDSVWKSQGRITLSAGRAGRSRRKKKKWREGGLNPRPLPTLLACLPGDHWHDAESARRQMATRCHTAGRVVRTSRCGRDNPGSTPGEDISSGQSEEKKTCLHHCIISRILQLDSL